MRLACKFLFFLLINIFISFSSISAAPIFDQAFWKHWGDGQAEIAAYKLTYPRYGESRSGTAVTIFVTETFSNENRVKVGSGKHSKSDKFPVLKLNLVKDFQTGIYDYNMMTSVFVGLNPRNGLPAGFPTKISFSSQEWCGHIYHQLLFDRNRVRSESHSYFDGEADREVELPLSREGFPADALLFWARGLSAEIGDGDIQTLDSLEYARLKHQPLSWSNANYSRSSVVQKLTVPAGKFDVTEASVKRSDGFEWRFFVETTAPHRIIKWETSEGEVAELLGEKRSKYWQQNDNRFESELKKIGLR